MARGGGGRWDTARAARFALCNWCVVRRGGWLGPQWGRSGAGGGVACWGARWRRNGGGRGGALARRGDADPNLWCQRGGRGRGAVGRASGSRQAGLDGCHDGRCDTCGCCRDAVEERARRGAVALLCSVIMRGRGGGRRVCGGLGGGWGGGVVPRGGAAGASAASVATGRLSSCVRLGERCESDGAAGSGVAEVKAVEARPPFARKRSASAGVRGGGFSTTGMGGACGCVCK